MSSLPEGSNNLGAWQSYDEKQYYKSISAIIGSSEKIKIDLKDFPFYGKVDNKGSQVMLPRSSTLFSESKLLTLSLLEDIPATDIVYNSFSSFKERMNLLSMRGDIGEDSVYYNVGAKISYLPWEIGFKNVMEQVIEDTFSYTLEQDKKKPILNVGDFYKMFQDYIYDSCPYSVLTLDRYLLSRFSDPLESGLIVEVATEDASDDEVKASKYLNDPAYSIFVDEAAYYGFCIDSSTPWRLVINPHSNYVKDYLSSVGERSFQSYLESNYISPSSASFDFFVRLILDSYRNLCLKSPNITSIKSGEAGTKFDLVDRVPLSPTQQDISSFVTKVGLKNMIKLYFYTKIHERNIFLKRVQFVQICEESFSFKKGDNSLDIHRCLGYIDNQVKKLDSNKKTKSEFRM